MVRIKWRFDLTLILCLAHLTRIEADSRFSFSFFKSSSFQIIWQVALRRRSDLRLGFANNGRFSYWNSDWKSWWIPRSFAFDMTPDEMSSEFLQEEIDERRIYLELIKNSARKVVDITYTLVITKGSIFWNVCTFWPPL